jgi:hypothetical protein
MAAAQDYKFEGWLGYDEASADGKMVWGDYEPKAWEETDIDIQVTHSGVCGSDLHSLRSGWVRPIVPKKKQQNRRHPDMYANQRNLRDIYIRDRFHTRFA